MDDLEIKVAITYKVPIRGTPLSLTLSHDMSHDIDSGAGR